jgi:hypothetical protein
MFCTIPWKLFCISKKNTSEININLCRKSQIKGYIDTHIFML